MQPRVVTTRTVGVLAVCSVAACGGRLTASHASPAEGGAEDASADVVAVPLPVDCSRSTLVVSPATTLTGIPQPSPPAGYPAGATLGPPLITAAATSAGDVVLVSLAWGPSGSFTVVRLTADDVTASPLVTASPAGQAAFDGQDLVLLSGTPSEGIGVQRVGSDGSLVGDPVTGLGGQVLADLTDEKAGAGPAVTVPSGAAITWLGLLSADSGVSGAMHASVIGPGSTLVHDEILPGRLASVATLGGRTYAASCPVPPFTVPVLTDLGWSGEPVSTQPVQGAYCPYGVPGSLAARRGLSWPVLSLGSKLGMVFSGSDGGFENMWLYEGEPDGPFTPVVPLPDYLATIAADGCGRVAILATSGAVGGPSWPALTAQAGSMSSQPLTLAPAAMTVAVAPTPGGFVVLWLAPTSSSQQTLQVATLTWQ